MTSFGQSKTGRSEYESTSLAFDFISYNSQRKSPQCDYWEAEKRGSRIEELISFIPCKDFIIMTMKWISALPLTANLIRELHLPISSLFVFIFLPNFLSYHRFVILFIKEYSCSGISQLVLESKLPQPLSLPSQ